MIWMMRLMFVLVIGGFFGFQLWALATERYGWLTACLVMDIIIGLFAKERRPGRHPQSIDP